MNLKATSIGRIFLVAVCFFLFAGTAFSDTGYQGTPPPPPPPPPKPPQLVVTWPNNGIVVTNSSIVVTGTLTNGDAPGAINLTGWSDATGLFDYNIPNAGSWSYPVDLVPGWNTLHLEAIDSGTRRADVGLRVYYRQLLPLQVVINGLGTVTPDLGETNLEVTQGYQMTAQPGPGYVFAGWTGDVVEPNSLTVSFTMSSNIMMLVANFVPTPFSTENYHGLIAPLDWDSQGIYGVLDLALTSEGDFTAKAQFGKDLCVFSGKFLANCSFETWINPVHIGLTDVELKLDPQRHLLTGNFVQYLHPNPSWDVVATISTYDAITNPAPQAGQYTLLIPGEADSTTGPGGDGYAAVSVDSSGKVSVLGKLGDGTPFSQKTVLSVDGQLLLYAYLYSGHGFISGRLTFTNMDGSDVVGAVNWVKTSGVKKGLYPSGFEIQSDVIGSRYDSTNLYFGNRFLMLTNGGLSEPITITGNPMIIPQRGSENQKLSGVSLKLSPKTGTFSGKVSGMPVNGVILPKQGFGGGYFVGTNETGRVYLGP